MEGALEFEGKQYISSRQAAHETGYAKDYIGQLCRSGKLDARLIGRSWYVTLASVEEHRHAQHAQDVEISDIATEHGDQDDDGEFQVPVRILDRDPGGESVHGKEAADVLADHESEPTRNSAARGVKLTVSSADDAHEDGKGATSSRQDRLRNDPSTARIHERGESELRRSSADLSVYGEKRAPTMAEQRRLQRQQALLGDIEAIYHAENPLFYDDEAPLFPNIVKPVHKTSAFNEKSLAVDRSHSKAQVRNSGAKQAAKKDLVKTRSIGTFGLLLTALLLALSAAVYALFYERSSVISNMHEQEKFERAPASVESGFRVGRQEAPQHAVSAPTSSPLASSTAHVASTTGSSSLPARFPEIR